MAPTPDCAHHAADIVALLAVAGQGHDEIGEKLGWAELADAGEPRSTDLGALEGYRASVYLGLCVACSTTVTSLRSWHEDTQTGKSRHWSTPWTSLARDDTSP